VNLFGKYLMLGLTLLLLCEVAWSQGSEAPVMQHEAEQLLALANQARAAAGAGPLTWDDALAVGARKHCLRMAVEGAIAHRYSGELDLTERAGQAGAHFDLIEENVAVGNSLSAIHNGWMNSPGHRANMLNPEVDRVGIAVVASRGVLYASADYARRVQQLTAEQIEAQVATLIQASGMAVLPDPLDARAACLMDSGIPRSASGSQPGSIVRWQSSDLNHLPKSLLNHLASRQYSRAAIGSCPPIGIDGTFTAYRVAVLLY
jgi:hypothetical protein